MNRNQLAQLSNKELLEALGPRAQQLVNTGQTTAAQIRHVLMAEQQKVRHEQHRDHTVDEVTNTRIWVFDVE